MGQDSRDRRVSAEGETSKIKSIKLLDKALIAFGGTAGRDVKFMAKDLSKREHYTMMARIINPETLEFDVHLTKEGSVKEYEPIVKVQFDISQWRSLKEEQFARILQNSLQKIDLDNPDSDVSGAAFATLPNPFKGEKISKHAKLTENSFLAMATDYKSMTYNQFLASGKDGAMVLREGKKSPEFMIRSGNELYLFNMEGLMDELAKLLRLDEFWKPIDQALKDREARQKRGGA